MKRSISNTALSWDPDYILGLSYEAFAQYT